MSPTRSLLLWLISLFLWGCPRVCTVNDAQIVHCEFELQKNSKFAAILPGDRPTDESLDFGDTLRTAPARSVSVNLAGIRRVSTGFLPIDSILLLLTEIKPLRDVVFEMVSSGSFAVSPSMLTRESDASIVRRGLADLVSQQWTTGGSWPTIGFEPRVFHRLMNLNNGELDDISSTVLVNFINLFASPEMNLLFATRPGSDAPLQLGVVIPKPERGNNLLTNVSTLLKVKSSVLESAGRVLIINIRVSSRSTGVKLTPRLAGSTKRFSYLLVGFISIEAGETHTIFRHLSKALLGVDEWFWDNGSELEQVDWATIASSHSGLPQMAVYQRMFDVASLIDEEEEDEQS